ncbi:Duffy receptor beta form [Liparis tanakae]|uniref:Duffy receptor beta form n=1 Tax=Liparis tanakae TaxID=230148 RepID=A0A4Z2GEZ6_9TELE|nr:Duffy receptor beta form [Liparis tanakae]
MVMDVTRQVEVCVGAPWFCGPEVLWSCSAFNGRSAHQLFISCDGEGEELIPLRLSDTSCICHGMSSHGRGQTFRRPSAHRQTTFRSPCSALQNRTTDQNQPEPEHWIISTDPGLSPSCGSLMPTVTTPHLNLKTFTESSQDQVQVQSTETSTDQVQSTETSTDQVQSTETSTDQVQSTETSTDQVQSTETSTDQVQTDGDRPGQTRTDQTRTDQTRTDGDRRGLRDPLPISTGAFPDVVSVAWSLVKPEPGSDGVLTC